MPTSKPRYCITVDDEMLRQIDNFRFENRYNSRSKATLELIKMGLDVLNELGNNDISSKSTHSAADGDV